MNTMDHAIAGRRVGPAAGRAGGGGAAVMLLALALLSGPAAVRAEPDPGTEREPDQALEREPERMTAEALMQTYLACDRASMAGRLGLGEIWRCSVVYETLKRRVFGGDFERLRAWSRSQPPVRSATGGDGQVDRGRGADLRAGRGG